MLAGVSLLTLSAISVDRLLALAVVGAQIQTSCNFEANICSRIYFLDCLYSRIYNVLLAFLFIVMACQDSYTTLSGNFILLLPKDFPWVASPSKSSTRECSRTTGPNNSSEPCTIQKGSFQCIVAAVDISCLLSAVFYDISFQYSSLEW